MIKSFQLVGRVVKLPKLFGKMGASKVDITVLRVSIPSFTGKDTILTVKASGGCAGFMHRMIRRVGGWIMLRGTIGASRIAVGGGYAETIDLWCDRFYLMEKAGQAVRIADGDSGEELSLNDTLLEEADPLDAALAGPDDSVEDHPFVPNKPK